MAAVDYFLKLDGIDGESMVDGHKGEIDIESWSLGGSQQGTFSGMGGGGSGKFVAQDAHFVTKYGKSSPKLFLYCCVGQHIPKGVLVCRKAGGKQEEYLKVTLSDLLVSSYQTGGSAHGGDVLPTCQFSLNFSKIEVEYKEQKQDGTLGASQKVGYDIKAVKKL